MAEQIASLVAEIGANTDGFRKGLSQAKSDLGSFANTIKDVGIGAVIGLTAAMVGFGVAAIKSASDSEYAVTQLRAALKSTGGAAGVTEQAALDLATALQKTTRYSDEQITAAETLLLRFKNIGKTVFPDATKAILDLATATGLDTDSAAKMVGKLLESADGLDAATRQGVRFTDAQKQLIKSLFASGQAAKAQGIILQQLQTQFGGAAEAAGNTFAGRLDQLKNALDDIFETVGGLVLPALTSLTKGFADLARAAGEGLQNFIQTIAKGIAGGNLGQILGNLVNGIAPVIYDVLKKLGFDPASAAQVTNSIRAFFSNIASEIGGLIADVFSPKIISEKIGHGVQEGAGFNISGPSGGDIVERLKKALGITPDTEKQLMATFTDIKNAIAPVLKDLQTGISGFFDAMKGTDFSGIGKLLEEFGKLQATFVGAGLGLAVLVIDALAKALPDLGTALKDFINVISDIMKGDTVKFMTDFAGLVQNLLNAFTTIQSTVIDGIVNALLNLLGMKGDFSVLNTLKDVLDRLYTAFSAVADAISKAVAAVKSAAGVAGTGGENFTGGGGGGGGAGFGGHATGGYMSAGSVSVVGERGPELFRPSVDGRIIPNSAIGGGGTNINLNGPIYITNPDPKAVLDAVIRAAKDKGANWSPT